MKKKIKKLYFIIPLVYILVILIFFLFHFLGKDPLKSESIGYLKMSGTKSRSAPFSEQEIVDLNAHFGGFNLGLSGSSPLMVEYRGGQREDCKIETYTVFEKNIEIRYTTGLSLSINVSGDLGTRAAISVKEFPAIGSVAKLLMPYKINGKNKEKPGGVPVVSCRTSFEQFFLSLQYGSFIDEANKLLVIECSEKNDLPLVCIEKGEKEYRDPYLYWYLEKTYPVTGEEYYERVDQYISRAYDHWISGRYDEDRDKWVNKDNSYLFDETIAKGLLSESLRISTLENESGIQGFTSRELRSYRRREYNRAGSLIVSAYEKRIREKPKEILPFLTSPFLGNLERVIEKFRVDDSILLKQVENLILKEDPAVFKTPHLLLLLLDRGNISLVDELVSRIVNNADPDSVDISTCLGMIEAYYEVTRWLDINEPYFQKYKNLILTHFIPYIVQTGRGLFLADREKKKSNVLESVRAGYILKNAAKISGNSDFLELGQKLILSALSLSDDQGFLPGDIVFQSFDKQDFHGFITPEEIYDYIVPGGYIPHEYPVYPDIRPGTWLWTAARDVRVQRTDTELYFTFSFPEGFTHYFFIQGIESFSALSLHGKYSEDNPEYARTGSGWHYSEAIQTLYVKLTHENEEEEIVIVY